MNFQFNTSAHNATSFQPTFFILVGIPGLEDSQRWVGIVFCLAYVIAVIGNMTLVLVIPMFPSLHGPMFIFLMLLASNDILLGVSIVPKMLSIFFSSSRLILFDVCLVQMFFLHSFTSIESGLLLAMAFDRYVAICKPLRYSSIVTSRLIVKIIVMLCVRPVVLFVPCILLVKRFKSFKTNIISHSYCEHMAVVKLADADIRVNSALGLLVAFTLLGNDLLFISLSYGRIFQAVYRLPSTEARLKAFNTCTPHICVFLSFYMLAFFSFLSHRYGKHIPSYIHIILSDLYLLVPPMINPLMYGIKTKLIRGHVWKLLCKIKTCSWR
ncbi:olfactory receptor 52A1-like [Spea bombifrons]|uniref:olfactory receptor 52A1-like n=1 Tax=Spea bombifrons TaxID=233779 RepID=UPI0023497BD4|nr:olfactory receptor 52A1-like [Spea bombifrons]